MVRFSCFLAQSHSHKNKKTVNRSSEAMQKTAEDSSQNQALMNPSYLKKENNPCLNEEGEEYEVSDHATDYSPTASEEMEANYITDNDAMVHKKGQFKKSQSLGSGLNWEHRTSGDDGSQDETEPRFSYDDNKHGRSQSVQFPEPIPSVSAQVGSDFAKNISMFSFGDLQPSEKEGTDKDDAYLSDDLTPCTQPGIAKSTSLPKMASPYRCSSSVVALSRSAEDLSTLNSMKESTMAFEAGRKLQYQGRDNSTEFNKDKKNVENPADETEDTYNYVDSAKDWIVPASNGEKSDKYVGVEISAQTLDEVPAKDFRLKRIEDWVTNLQHYDPTDESNESDTTCYGEELSEGNALLEEPASLKSEVKVSPGMEAAKRYISSLNASATAAQLTNLGLVVIPFLSSFVSLKALNLSGNAIVRIAAGALPRGLHVLNLSKNNISTIEGLRDLTRLRVLDLSYNRILRIGHGLAACSSLKELYLAGNKISEVEGLHRLLKLSVLDLRFNKISTKKCLGQLAANYNCLQALSLEGNPAQKNVGDEQLKKYLQSLLPQLVFYNRQSIKVGTVKDLADRSSRLGIGTHQVDRGLRAEVKNVRKGAHGIVAQKVPSSHSRKSQAAVTGKMTRSRHGRLPPSGIKTGAAHGQQFTEVGSKVLNLRDDFSFTRSRSEGNLGGL